MSKKDDLGLSPVSPETLAALEAARERWRTQFRQRRPGGVIRRPGERALDAIAALLLRVDALEGQVRELCGDVYGHRERVEETNHDAGGD